ncbi:MAG: DnaD domain protein [Clostridia bacterium]|nr:DnaD domain protein [Clostridia bacterium]
MGWISVYDTLREHPKTYDLADKLKIEQYAAGGIVVFLWTWALINAPDGDLTKFPDGAIARACFWDKKPKMLMDALSECGWLDPPGLIHDWGVYAGALMDKEDRRRENDRIRQQRFRDKKANGKNRDAGDPVTPRNASVTRDAIEHVTPCHAPTKEEKREEDITEDNNSREEERDITGIPPSAADMSAVQYCDMCLRGMSPGNYEELRSFMEDGLSDELIKFAVDDACGHGKRAWSYVSKILSRYVVEGIRTVDQARAGRKDTEAANGNQPPQAAKGWGGDL